MHYVATPLQAKLDTLRRSLDELPWILIFVWLAADLLGLLESLIYPELLTMLWLRGLLSGMPITFMAALTKLDLPGSSGFRSFSLGLLALLSLSAFLPKVHVLWLLGFVLVGSLISAVVAIFSVVQHGRNVCLAMDKLVPVPQGAVLRARLVACHLSDIHVTRNSCLSVEGHQDGLPNLISAIRQIAELRPHYLFITGDLTDSGQDEEWKSVMAELDVLRNKNTRVLAAPGNHDLNWVYAQESPVAGESRQLFERFTVNVSLLSGDVETHSGKPLRKLLEEFETGLVGRDLKPEARQRRESAINELARAPLLVVEGMPGRTRAAARVARGFAISNLAGKSLSYWEEIVRAQIRESFFDTGRTDWFPLIFRDPDDQSCVLIMNSVPVSSSLGEGALGAWGRKQLARFKEMLTQLSDVHFLWVLTHHAPFRRWADGATWQECWDYALLSHQVEEARSFATLLVDFAAGHPGSQVHVLCGHRHKRDAGLCGTVKVLESDALTANEGAGWLLYAADNGSYVLPR